MQITLSSFWLIFLIGLNIFSIFATIVIKLNDMKHLKNKVKWICGKLEELGKETGKQGERISRIEGRLNGKGG